jgi:hypothetical protein
MPKTKADRKGIPQCLTRQLPFVLVIDEAAYLYQTHYMHSFLWVLDQPVMKVLHNLRETTPAANRFFVIMLGTHSQISHFAPHYELEIF